MTASRSTTAELGEAILVYLARSRARLMLVQIEDVAGEAEQANLPGTTDRIRTGAAGCHAPLEELLAGPEMARIAALVAEARRRSAAERPTPMSEAGTEAVAIRATYRLQFHKGFTFRDAEALVPYLARLGISHLYASPLMQARPGSTHGYDIVNHDRLNPEIGTEDEFEALVAALAAHGMGLIVDIVPNHMGVGGADNAWWLDVLEWGENSPYAAYFDINWDPIRDDLKGRVLLPVLGDQYGAVLESGEIALRFDPAEGSFSAWYYEHRFPISPAVLPRRSCATAARRWPSSSRRFRGAAAAAAERGAPAAAELKRRLAEAAADPETAAAIEAALRAFAGRARPIRPASAGCTGCSKSRPIGSRSGASRPRRSTTAAFSTSTTWPGCASNCRSCSRRRTG